MQKLDLPKEPQRLEDNVAVWAEFSQVSAKYKMISLAEGAPIENPPKFVQENMMQSINEGFNQYCRTFGHPELVNKVCEIYGQRFNRKINPLTEILITPGANGALHAFISAFINPGDEIAMFDPQFPLYLDHIRICSGTVKSCPLEIKDGQWTFDPQKLRDTLSDKTRMFIFNNPHNPTGKNFTKEEIEQISKVLDEFP